MKPVEGTKALMGTNIQIQINNPERKIAALDAIDKAFEEFSRAIKIFSRFDQNSELMKLNKSQGRWFRASKELYNLTSLSLKAAKETNYKYDPTIIDILTAYGYDKNFNEERIQKRMQTESFQREIQHLMKNRPHPREIKLDKKNQGILLQKFQRLDLGSLAKGYAIDLARDVLKKKFEFDDFTINAGGDVWAAGRKQTALFDPREPGSAAPFKTIEIKNKAIAGSGSFARKAGFFHHLIDPANLNVLKTHLGSNQKKEPEKSEKILQTYVIAPTATEADLYATALFLTGTGGLQLIKQKNYKALIYSDSKILGDTDLIN